MTLAPYQPIDDQGKELEVVFVCNECETFYNDNIPGCDIGNVVREKKDDEAFALEIDDARDLLHADVAAHFAPPDADGALSASSQLAGRQCGLVTRKNLVMQRQWRGSAIVREIYALRTHSEIIARHQKTPKSLKCKPITWPDHRHKDRTLYPLADDDAATCTKQLLLDTAISDMAISDQSSSASCFPSQVNRILAIQRSDTNKSFLPCMGPGAVFPSTGQLQARADRLEEVKKPKKKDRWENGFVADVGGELDESDGEYNSDELDGEEESEEEQADMDADGDADIENTP